MMFAEPADITNCKSCLLHQERILKKLSRNTLKSNINIYAPCGHTMTLLFWENSTRRQEITCYVWNMPGFVKNLTTSHNDTIPCFGYNRRNNPPCLIHTGSIKKSQWVAAYAQYSIKPTEGFFRRKNYGKDFKLHTT